MRHDGTSLHIFLYACKSIVEILLRDVEKWDKVLISVLSGTGCLRISYGWKRKIAAVIFLLLPFQKGQLNERGRGFNIDQGLLLLEGLTACVMLYH